MRQALINALARPSSKWSLRNRLLMLSAGTSDARGYRQWREVGRHVRAGSPRHFISWGRSSSRSLRAVRQHLIKANESQLRSSSVSEPNVESCGLVNTPPHSVFFWTILMVYTVAVAPPQKGNTRAGHRCPNFAYASAQISRPTQSMTENLMVSK